MSFGDVLSEAAAPKPSAEFAQAASLDGDVPTLLPLAQSGAAGAAADPAIGSGKILPVALPTAAAPAGELAPGTDGSSVPVGEGKAKSPAAPAAPAIDVARHLGAVGAAPRAAAALETLQQEAAATPSTERAVRSAALKGGTDLPEAATAAPTDLPTAQAVAAIDPAKAEAGAAADTLPVVALPDPSAMASVGSTAAERTPAGAEARESQAGHTAAETRWALGTHKNPVSPTAATTGGAARGETPAVSITVKTEVNETVALAPAIPVKTAARGAQPAPEIAVASHPAPQPASAAAPSLEAFAPAQPVQAPLAAAPAPAPTDLSAVLDRLVAAREALMPAQAAFDIQHAEFGEISIRFEQSTQGLLSVEVASADPELQRAVTAAVATERSPSSQADSDSSRSNSNSARGGAADRESSSSSSSTGREAQSRNEREPSHRRAPNGSRSEPNPSQSHSGIFA